MKNLSAFIDYLETLANADEDTISRLVATDALDRDEEDVIPWFEHVLQYGCENGIAPSLIYVIQTHLFFDKYYYEIMNLKEAQEQSLGHAMSIPYLLKNYLAYFAYEVVAQRIYRE